MQELTERLIALQFVRAAVYVLFQNCAYAVHRVRKDHALGRFVWTSEHEV